ncbi:methionyl-tRNA formyltransferase [Salinimicrobium sediminilitoris]|uniref:methionyl-tRNA formyltransferase n=1 Tax=Salinimicrobium sediminilitoris TaxID=2876715 RepID=UPI001E4DFC50|nr:methionyl-tRNA formyltransferase [Salinimicrobium sediminilitoris]MCC8358749.1 methionyl-tRNA formyltransferase [Salinimicrobium sediminilitoris]
MKSFIILSEKKWHKALFDGLKERNPDFNWILLDKKDDFSLDKLQTIEPEKIFIPHWSYIIPAEIYENFECVIFHETDLPFGRGGSPIQNLISRGINDTKISALKAGKGLDTGPVYLKRELNLNGTTREIFIRCSAIIREMIEEIIYNEVTPLPQEGEVVNFKRRKPEDGNLNYLKEVKKMYDYIRMLDCEGYPPAFIENEHFRFEFTRASLQSDKEILADVRIIKK